MQASGLISVERARELSLERARPLGAEPVPLREALGRVLAEPVDAADDVPGFDNSAMDGYAVRAADTIGAGEGSAVELAVVAESRAGHPAPRELGAGEAIAISTGAVLPAGADAVVRVEDTERIGEPVRILAAVDGGRNVRRAGEDIRAGERLLEPGRGLGAAELGVLASVGWDTVQCAHRPRVAILSTGDELVEPGIELAPGQIRNSNAYSVPPLATAAGAELVAVEQVPDAPAATREALARALEADVVAVCGGVSVGEHDHVRPALEGLGVEQVFWGVALRPGKPTYLGVAPGGALVFGLPGNPVSAMVTFTLFARPALYAMQGRDPAARRLTATLGAAYEKAHGRGEAIRCRLEAGERGWIAHPTGPQGSDVLTSMLGADGLAFGPAERNRLEAGERLEVELLR